MRVKPTGRRGKVLVEVGPRDPEKFTEGLERQNRSLFNLTRILAPTDFSTTARKAVEYAIRFAEQFEASLHLIFVTPSPAPIPGIMDFPPPDTASLKHGEAKLLELKKEIGGKVPVETLVRLGIPHHEIVRAANELEIDLIVLGTHGYSGLRHIFLGSTAELVVRHAHCPVLVVRDQEREFIPAKNQT